MRQAAFGVMQKQPGQKSEQGHVHQINPSVLSHQQRVMPNPRLYHMTVDHQKNEEQFDIAITRVSETYHAYHLSVRAGRWQNVTDFEKMTRRIAVFPKFRECDKILIKCVTEGLFWNLLSRKVVRLWQISGSSTGITML